LHGSSYRELVKTEEDIGRQMESESAACTVGKWAASDVVAIRDDVSQQQAKPPSARSGGRGRNGRATRGDGAAKIKLRSIHVSFGTGVPH
jgi:hypothetical protein